MLDNSEDINLKKPGMVVEALQLLEKKAQVQFEYVRQPWKRTLNNLRAGKLDAVIYTSYHPDLEKSCQTILLYHVFPPVL